MSEKRLSFLYEATKVVPKNDCGTFIRCQLLSKCNSITNVNLPAQNFKASVMCQGCGVELADEPPKTLLKKPPKTTKLVKKINKMIDDRKPLTPYLKKIHKTFDRKNYQQLITVCKMCRKRNIVKIRKPQFKSTPINNKEQKTTPQSAKRKKKDLYSGLNKSAVMSVSQNNLNKKQKNKANPNENNIVPNNVHQKGEPNKKSNVDFIPLDANKPSTSLVIAKNVKPDKRQVSLENNINPNNKKKRNKDKKKKNKIQNGRIQKNEVLKKTEKDINKKQQNFKNLANILNEKPRTSNSLCDFLKNL